MSAHIPPKLHISCCCLSFHSLAGKPRTLLQAIKAFTLWPCLTLSVSHLLKPGCRSAGLCVPVPGSQIPAHAQLPQVGLISGPSCSTILTFPTRSSPGDFYQPLEKHRSHHFLQEFSVILPFTQSAMFFSVLVLCVCDCGLTMRLAGHYPTTSGLPERCPFSHLCI